MFRGISEGQQVYPGARCCRISRISARSKRSRKIISTIPHLRHPPQSYIIRAGVQASSTTVVGASRPRISTVRASYSWRPTAAACYRTTRQPEVASRLVNRTSTNRRPSNFQVAKVRQPCLTAWSPKSATRSTNKPQLIVSSCITTRTKRFLSM